jgi:hypothetical protein
LVLRGRFRCGLRGLLACFVWCVVPVRFGRSPFLPSCLRAFLLLWALRLLRLRGLVGFLRLVAVPFRLFLLLLFLEGCVVVASSLAPVVGSVLPPPVAALVAGARSLAFSGSRSVVPSVLAPVLALVSPRAFVAVGCASGVDAAVRSGLEGACVFRAASFSASSWSARLALRSAAVVRAGSGRSPSLVVVFPSSVCPRGLAPSPVVSACFAGFGSGSWASAAFAAGLGVPLLVFAPLGVPAWGFVSLGSGWWLLSPSPSLF